ncbi:MAG TPA: hypothetical protein VMZ28_11315 [Kofleriaceae bacterium]|nr:hypothetical protein [Kofleriaceae bacterium]
MKSSIAVAVAVAVAAALGGCDKKQETGNKVTVSSEPTAKDPIVDEDYRFKLAWPGSGWKILRERDIRRVSPDAVAGLTNDKVWGAVIVEQAPGMELDAFGKLIIDQLAVEQRAEVRRERVKYAGVDAIDFAVDGLVQGAPVRFTGRVFLNGGWAYQVLAWSLRSNADDAAFRTVFDAFSILPGEVVGRASVAGARDADGVGWRVRGGLFESAVAGVRARAPAGWNVVTGDELAKLDPGADLGLVSSSPEAYLMVVVERAPGLTRDAYRQRRLDGMEVDQVPGPVRARFLGADVELQRLRAREHPIDYLFTVEQRGDRMIQLLAWYAGGLRAQAEPGVLTAMAAIDALDEAAVAALDRELAAAPDTQNAVGPDFALRRGRFRHFGLGLEWTRPDGYWRVSVGQAAREQNALALLYAEEPRRGLHMMLVSGPMSAPPFTVTERHPAMLAGLPGEAIVGESGADAGVVAGLAWHVTAAPRGADHLQLWVWGFAADMRARAAEVAALAGRLASQPMVAVEFREPYRDHRLGFQVSGLDDWTRSDDTPPDLAPLGTVVTWKRGRAMMFVIGLCGVSDATDEDWFADFMQQTFIDKLGLAGATAQPADQASIGGRSARHVRSESLHGRADMYLISRDETLYGVLAVDEEGGGDADRTARSAFTLLD